MSFETEYINGVWQVEKEILDVVNNICKKNNIRYSLAYGTLIGAVRHKGFIPWDDDIDIIMPREDYDNFIRIWNEDSPEGYILQNKSTNEDFSQSFTKIRKDHTTFLQTEEEAKATYHKGIFIDIFPYDKVANKKFSWLIQYISCAVNLLYSRGFTSGTGGVIGIVEKVLLKMPKKIQKKMYDVTERTIQKWNDKDGLKYFCAGTFDSLNNHYSKDLFSEFTTLEFCGSQYSCVKDYDGFLKTGFGDYMKLPPEDERVWKHHPILIDFEHNYEEL